MERDRKKTGLSHEINDCLFEFAAANFQNVTADQISKWFNYTNTIDDIEVVYWITPGVVLGAVIKDSETGKRTYTILEPNSIFISDPIPNGLHDKIDAYKQAKHSSDYRIICAVATDPFVDRCVIANDIVTVYHYHCNETLRLTNLGTPINTQQFITQLKQRYNNQITETFESMLDVIQLRTEQHHTILCTSPESNSPAVTIKFRSRNPHTPYDLIAEETYSTESLAYLWSMISHGKNILCCASTQAIKNEIVEALTHFTPTTDQLITYSDIPRLNIPHKTSMSLIAQHGTTLAPEELTKEIIKENPEYVVTTTIDDVSMRNPLLDESGTGFIAGTTNNSILSIPEKHTPDESGFDTTTFDVVTYHKYIDEGIGVNEEIIEITPTGEPQSMSHSACDYPLNIHTTHSTHTTSDEITYRENALNKLSSEHITDSHEQHKFLSKCNNKINNNDFNRFDDRQINLK